MEGDAVHCTTVAAVHEEWGPGVRVPYQSCAICEGVGGIICSITMDTRRTASNIHVARRVSEESIPWGEGGSVTYFNVDRSVRQVWYSVMNKDASISTNRSAPYHRCTIFGVSHLHHLIPVGLVHLHLSPLHCQYGGGVHA